MILFKMLKAKFISLHELRVLEAYNWCSWHICCSSFLWLSISDIFLRQNKIKSGWHENNTGESNASKRGNFHKIQHRMREHFWNIVFQKHCSLVFKVIVRSFCSNEVLSEAFKFAVQLPGMIVWCFKVEASFVVWESRSLKMKQDRNCL